MHTKARGFGLRGWNFPEEFYEIVELLCIQNCSKRRHSLEAGSLPTDRNLGVDARRVGGEYRQHVVERGTANTAFTHDRMACDATGGTEEYRSAFGG